MSADGPKPRRTRRRFVILTMSLLILGLVCAYWLGKAWVVRNRVVAILGSAGIHVTHLRITDATPWHAQVEDLVAGPDGALKVRQISIHYTPTRLFHRSVERIVISGADVDATIADSVKFESGGSAPVSPAPFSSIELIDSKIRIGKSD